ncbi:PIR protein, putative [Plasmodium sp.]|nr:PIR protein, putative [Plasmodium sp.]
MKLQYYKILLFSILLNILANNKNKPHTTPHTPTTTSRVLSECDIYTSIYDKDEDIKSVRENFDRQSSQRFEEYNKRMTKNRKKCKEQCDKDIQNIILKDKVQKSLAKKVEERCLMCGCVLGGGVAPVWGLISGLWYATWSQYVATTVVKMATDAGIKKGLEVGLANVVKIVTKLSSGKATIPTMDALQNITAGISADDVTLYGIFNTIDINGCGSFEYDTYAQFSMWVQTMAKPFKLKSYSVEAAEITEAFADAKTGILTKAGNSTSSLTTAITASFIVIVVIVLVMLIIYLILRYRRKKKNEKKLEYTKLLKE